MLERNERGEYQDDWNITIRAIAQNLCAREICNLLLERLNSATSCRGGGMADTEDLSRLK